jgi:hypothetical protein
MMEDSCNASVNQVGPCWRANSHCCARERPSDRPLARTQASAAPSYHFPRGHHERQASHKQATSGCRRPRASVAASRPQHAQHAASPPAPRPAPRAPRPPAGRHMCAPHAPHAPAPPQAARRCWMAATCPWGWWMWTTRSATTPWPAASTPSPSLPTCTRRRWVQCPHPGCHGSQRRRRGVARGPSGAQHRFERGLNERCCPPAGPARCAPHTSPPLPPARSSCHPGAPTPTTCATPSRRSRPTCGPCWWTGWWRWGRSTSCAATRCSRRCSCWTACSAHSASHARSCR